MQQRVYGIETEYGYVGGPITTPSMEWLSNGGRIYVDGTHPEYCTPECRNPRDLVKYDKAGELIVQTFFKGKFYKNNVAIDAADEKKVSSFGCHQNYLIKPYSISRLAPALIPFLVTQPLITGSGGGLSFHGSYLISPRAMHLGREHGPTTTFETERAIVNTKDEPLADPSKYKRLHLIHADANMSEVATYMKIGMTSIVLDLLEEDRIVPLDLVNPVAAMKLLCMNTDGNWKVRIKGGEMKATDVQRIYLETAYRYVHTDSVTEDILKRWGNALDSLDRDPQELAGWVEWVLKREALLGMAKEEGIPLSHPRIKNLELQLTDIDRRESAFYFLEKKGVVERLLSDDEIIEATQQPPADTRAYCRGRMVSSRTKIPRTINWDHVITDESYYSLKDPLDSYRRYLNKEYSVNEEQKKRESLFKSIIRYLFGCEESS